MKYSCQKNVKPEFYQDLNLTFGLQGRRRTNRQIRNLVQFTGQLSQLIQKVKDQKKSRVGGGGQ